MKLIYLNCQQRLKGLIERLVQKSGCTFQSNATALDVWQWLTER